MGNPPLVVGLLINGVAYAAIFIVVAVLLSRFASESPCPAHIPYPRGLPRTLTVHKLG